MTLAAYLKLHGLSYSAFARQLGERHPRTVERYAKGQALPRPAMMARIREATGGAVTADDFYAGSAE